MLFRSSGRYKPGAKPFQLVVEVDLKDGAKPVEVEVEFLAPKEVKLKKNRPKFLPKRTANQWRCNLHPHCNKEVVKKVQVLSC